MAKTYMQQMAETIVKIYKQEYTKEQVLAALQKMSINQYNSMVRAFNIQSVKRVKLIFENQL